MDAWAEAYDADGKVRDGAWVAELTGLIDLTDWPPGMQVIVRKERPHPGAQLRFTDRDGLRLTAFATSKPTTTCGTGIQPWATGHRPSTLRPAPTPTIRWAVGSIETDETTRAPLPGGRVIGDWPGGQARFLGVFSGMPGARLRRAVRVSGCLG
jgi:hypothetical protein